MSNLLSVYCFYKNERDVLPETVPSWLPFIGDGGELVLVDTGSDDDSFEFCEEVRRSCPAGLGIDIRLERLPWPDPLNWAAITAQTMALCSRPWRMRLDADEKLAGEPRALTSVLKNLERACRLQEEHAPFDVSGAVPVALGGLALALYEPETGVHQYRSRLHRGAWSWRYRIDPTPAPPAGEDGGVFLILQDWICHAIHTRASIRPEALARMEGVLELARRLDGPLDAMAEAHYANGIERVRLWGKRSLEERILAVVEACPDATATLGDFAEKLEDVNVADLFAGIDSLVACNRLYSCRILVGKNPFTGELDKGSFHAWSTHLLEGETK